MHFPSNSFSILDFLKNFKCKKYYFTKSDGTRVTRIWQIKLKILWMLYKIDEFIYLIIPNNRNSEIYFTPWLCNSILRKENKYLLVLEM